MIKCVFGMASFLQGNGTYIGEFGTACLIPGGVFFFTLKCASRDVDKLSFASGFGDVISCGCVPKEVVDDQRGDC